MDKSVYICHTHKTSMFWVFLRSAKTYRINFAMDYHALEQTLLDPNASEN